MKKLFAVTALILLLFCGCDTDVTSPEPTSSPTRPPRQDAVSDMLPLHLSRDGSLIRVYSSQSEIVNIKISDNFCLNYGGKSYEIIKYYRASDVLYYGADYSVKEGVVLCDLYRYDGKTQTVDRAVRADSVIFADDGVAYIKNGELYLYKEGQTQKTASQVTACCFAADNADSLIYLKDGKLYKGQEPLGDGGDIIFAKNGIVMAQITEPQNHRADVNVFFTDTGKSFTVEDVYLSFGFVDGYLFTKKGLIYLNGDDSELINSIHAVEVQGGEGVVGYNDDGICSYYYQGKERQLNISQLPLEAYYVRGRILVKTKDWLYDGSSIIGDPQRVKYLDSELYMLYENANGITAVIRKLDGVSPVVDSALADTPFYSVGGKICYFVKQSFTKEIYRLKIGKDFYIDNADPSSAPKGNSQLTELVFYRDGYPVLYYHGTQYEFENCKIYL